MAKQKPQSFGNSLEEVDSNIASLEAERKALSENVGTKKFKKKDNARFEQISSDLEAANRERSNFQPIASGGPQDAFTEQRTEVMSDPNQIAQTPGMATGLNPSTPEVGSIETPGIGEIVTPQSGSDNIVDSALGGINREGTTSVDDEINKSIFGQDPKNAQGVQKQATPMIEQGMDLYPGLTDPINKGTVSGQVIGNQPIFVGGGDFMAVHVLNNRKKAIQDAATQRQMEASDLLSAKPPIVKDQRFQGDLNNQFFSTQNKYVDEAKRVYGEDWDLALKDQSNPLGKAFVQDMANYDFIAGQADQVTDLVGEIDADLESGDAVFSDATLQLRDDYNQLQGDFLNGAVSGGVNLADKYNQLKGFTSLDKILNDQNINIESGLTIQSARIGEDDDKYVTETQKIVAYEEQVRIIAKGLAKGQMRDAVLNGSITEDDIFNQLNARYGYQDITDKKITTKPKASGGVKVEVDLNGEFGNPKDEKINGWKVKTLDEVNIDTEFPSVDASGLTEYGPQGQKLQVNGVRNVDFTDFQVDSYVDTKGKTHYAKVVIGTHEVTDAFGNTTTVTRAYDLEPLRGRILEEGYMDAENFDNMITRFDKKIPATNNTNTDNTNTDNTNTNNTNTNNTNTGGDTGGTSNIDAAWELLNQEE